MRLEFFKRGDRPLFLWLGTLLLILTGLLGLVTWGLVVLDQVHYPGIGITEFAGARLVGPGQHLAATPLVLGYIGAQILVGYGLLAKREWARPTAVAFWPASAAVLSTFQVGVGVAWGEMVPGVIDALIVTVIAWWYLYRAPVVLRYFEEGAGALTE